MKSSWEKVKLVKVCEFKYGRGLPKRKRIKGKFPVYGSGGIVDYHNIFFVKGPGIIIGRKGTIGSVYFEKRNFFPIDTVFYIEENKGKYDLRFLSYVLKNLDFNALNSDAAVPGLNRNVAYSQKVFFTDLLTQNKIASILSAYDDLIENNNRRIKILEEIAQLIYKEWFVKFRFPGHEQVKMVDSELGKIPEGWKVERLSDLVKTQYGYTESASNEEIGPKFLRGTDINKKSYIDWSSVPYCIINEENFEKYKLKRGDILIIRMADPGKVGIIEKDLDAVFASYLIRIKILNNYLTNYYLFYFLLSDEYQNYITGASTGTTRKSASAGVVTSIKILVPPIYLITKFEAIVSSLRRNLNNYLNRISILKKTRDLLLPKLISGKIDVGEVNMEVKNG